MGRGKDDKKGGKKGKKDKDPTRADGDLRQNINALNSQLSPLSLIVRNVPGDGNCMFYAVERHVEGNSLDARQVACRYMADHPDDFAPFLDTEEFPTFAAYLDAMRQNYEWGGHMELRALACALHMHIVVHAVGQPALQISCPRPRVVVHLAYLMEEHYGCVEYQSLEVRDAWCKRCLVPGGATKPTWESQSEDSSSEGSSSEEEVVFRMATLKVNGEDPPPPKSSKKPSKHDKKVAKKNMKLEAKGPSKAPVVRTTAADATRVAIAQVVETKREEVSPNPGFIYALVKWEEKILGQPSEFDVRLYSRFRGYFSGSVTNKEIRTLFATTAHVLDTDDRDLVFIEAMRAEIKKKKT